jgi:hypothetical protein
VGVFARVVRLYPKLHEAKTKKRCSYAELAQVLAEAGIAIKSTTLRIYMQRIRQRNAAAGCGDGAAKRRPRRNPTPPTEAADGSVA